MDIENMTYEEIQKRLTELGKVVDRSEDLDELQRISDEATLLRERQSELYEFMQRRADTRSLNGEADPDPSGVKNVVQRERAQKGNKTMNDSTEVRAFEKWVRSGGDVKGLTEIEERALNIAGSAAVLPVEIWDKLITGEAYSDLLSRATIINEANAGKIYIPIASNTSASWKIENSSVDGDTNTYEATPTLTKLELGGFELYRWMQVSAATMSRATGNFTDLMLNLLGSEVIEALEAAFVAGVGTTEPKGLDELTWTPDTNQILTASAVTPIAAADVAEALSLLPQKYARNALVLVNSDMAYNMSQFKGTSEYAYNMADGATKFLGHDIVISEHMSDDTVYIVDPKELYVRFAMPLSLEVDKSSGFTSASYNLRALTVVDAVWNPAACVAVGLGTGGA
jgi:HK97 family phage major capsid protein